MCIISKEKKSIFHFVANHCLIALLSCNLAEKNTNHVFFDEQIENEMSAAEVLFLYEYFSSNKRTYF